jgi:hypothetical protein
MQCSVKYEESDDKTISAHAKVLAEVFEVEADKFVAKANSTVVEYLVEFHEWAEEPAREATLANVPLGGSVGAEVGSREGGGGGGLDHSISLHFYVTLYSFLAHPQKAPFLSKIATTLSGLEGEGVHFGGLAREESKHVKTIDDKFHLARENNGERPPPQRRSVLAPPPNPGGYPNISLEAYIDEGEFWHINKKFRGLQAIHKVACAYVCVHVCAHVYMCVQKYRYVPPPLPPSKTSSPHYQDPWIFLVHGLLTPQQCSDFICKGGSHFTPSTSQPSANNVKKERTSCDVRIPFDETPKTQNIFRDVLNASVSQFEPLKLIRYEDGQYFKPHHDADEDTPRRITLFVYLNDCDHGETHFTRYGIKVEPRVGMGLIHFPSRLSTAKDPPQAEYVEGAKVELPSNCHGTVRGVVELHRPNARSTQHRGGANICHATPLQPSSTPPPQQQRTLHQRAPPNQRKPPGKEGGDKKKRVDVETDISGALFSCRGQQKT